MYSIGDYISYGNSGVCEVMGTEVMDPSAGAASGRTCYVLRPLHDRSCKIMTPVDNEKVIMRRLISPEETRQLLEDIPQIETLPEQSARQQEISYSKALHSGASNPGSRRARKSPPPMTAISRPPLRSLWRSSPWCSAWTACRQKSC